jgi:signal transduction histidine kinase
MIALHFEISDIGIGLSVGHLPDIFERFYRVEQSRTQRGIGPGLAITWQIVQAHGGGIEVKSAPGAGTKYDTKFLFTE